MEIGENFGQFLASPAGYFPKDYLNSLPIGTFLDWSIFKAFVEDKIILIVFGIVENIVGKGENVGYQSFPEVLNVRIVW